MNITTLLTGAAAALTSLWTALAFVRCQMIMTMACGFGGASPDSRLVADAQWTFLLGCAGAGFLVGLTLIGVFQRMRVSGKGRAAAAYHPAGFAPLPTA
jgi:hypothetical protein